MASAWVNRFSIGAGIEKSFGDTSHHSEFHQWFRVPDKSMGELETRVIQSFMSGSSLCLSEHAKEKTRLFLDLDVNKGDGVGKFTEEHFMSFLTAFLPFLNKENRHGRCVTLFTSPTLALTLHRFFANTKFLSSQIGKGPYPKWFSPFQTFDEWDTRNAVGETVVGLKEYVINSHIRNSPPIFVVLKSVTGTFHDGAPCGTLHVIFPFHLDTKRNWVGILKSFKEKYPQYGFLDAEAMSNGTLRSFLSGKGPKSERPFIFDSFWNGLEKLSHSQMRDFLVTSDEEQFLRNVFRASTLRLSDDITEDDEVPPRVPIPIEDPIVEEHPLPEENFPPLSPLDEARRRFIIPGPPFSVEDLKEALDEKKAEIDMNPDAKLLDYLEPFTEIIANTMNRHIAFIDQAGKPLYVYRQRTASNKIAFFHSTHASAKSRFSYKYLFTLPSRPNKVNIGK